MLGVVLGKLCLHVCVSIIFPSDMLAAQVLVCLSLGWSVGGCANALYVSTIFPSERLAVQVLVFCLSVGLKCGSSADVGCTGTCVPIDCVESSADVGCTGICVPMLGWSVGSSAAGTVVLTNSMLYHLSDKLAAQVLVCVPIGWVKCWKFCACWMHRYLCVYRWVEV